MTVYNPVPGSRRILWNALRSLRRFTRQVERRLRYKRLGWV